MDRSFHYAKLSSSVRRAWESLSRVTTALEDLNARDLAAECFEAELKLLELHSQLVEASSQPASGKQSSRGAGESQLPF